MQGGHGRAAKRHSQYRRTSWSSSRREHLTRRVRRIGEQLPRLCVCVCGAMCVELHVLPGLVSLPLPFLLPSPLSLLPSPLSLLPSPLSLLPSPLSLLPSPLPSSFSSLTLRRNLMVKVMSLKWFRVRTGLPPDRHRSWGQLAPPLTVCSGPLQRGRAKAVHATRKVSREFVCSLAPLVHFANLKLSFVTQR